MRRLSTNTGQLSTKFDENTAQLSQMAKDIQSLKIDVQGSAISLSATDLGGSEIQKLEQNGNLLTFQPTSGDSILSSEEMKHVQTLVVERDLIKFINSKLQPILKPRVACSSESHPWLWTSTMNSQTKLKPDTFICYRGFVRKSGDEGVPAHDRILEGVNAVDYKLERTPKAFGELIIHLQSLHHNIRRYCDRNHMFIVKGALACKDGIWLVRVERTTVHDALKLSWTDAGGREKLKTFFAEENLIAKAAENFLASFNKDLYELKGTSFLGIGGTGCVFLVHDREQSAQVRTAQAMKVVIGAPNIPLLKAEYMMNIKISQSAENVIMRASDIKYQLDGAGMLMSDVGAAIESNQYRKRMAALDLIVKLHQAGYYHGDARKQNLLEFCGNFKWCDLQRAGILASLPDDEQRQAHLMHDICMILNSFGYDKLAPAKRDTLREYAENMTIENLTSFVSGVCEDFLKADTDFDLKKQA